MESVEPRTITIPKDMPATKAFRDPQKLATWLHLAILHGGKFLPEETTTRQVELERPQTQFETTVTVWIPGESFQSFRNCCQAGDIWKDGDLKETYWSE